LNVSRHHPIEALREEGEALQRLVSVLRREQEVLVQGDVNALTRITGEKAEIVSRLTELARFRNEGLAAAGFTPNEAGMRAWLTESPQPEFASAWTAVISMARVAKELNRVNGLLIAKHLARSQQTIRLLAGECGMFYGADGQPMVVPATHSFAVR
jgi:flagella synthesis protein FlgN